MDSEFPITNNDHYINARMSHPDKIFPSVMMNTPNQAIPVYEGEFMIQNEAVSLVLTGTITFEWFPSAGCVFVGVAKNTTSFFL